eukprot:TRINITY_DN49168_c0_g1_i1.p1 TRINITY_DN49168_c0_g1~~TRINITY_DN49168_c0_g1_i1.p1  ORF type:complete len:280 (+),score=57.52 TRINITY_DN49168_c0_g1_i1:106-945(+)
METSGQYEVLPGAARTTAARRAFDEKNAEASAQAHQVPVHREPTSSEGKFLKPIIFGGLDGVSTIFAFVAGAIGADLELTAIIALGCAQLFAGAFGMGFGEYLSSEAERQVAVREEARERWEVEVNPEGEVREMIDIYVQKGLARDDAEVVAKTLSKYEDFWVEHMMLHEIGMIPPEGDAGQALVQGLIMFCSFLTLGALPLVAYVVSRTFYEKSEHTMVLSLTCVAAVVAMAFLGVVKAYMADMSLWKGGVGMAFQGVLSAGGAYWIGNMLPEILNLS